MWKRELVGTLKFFGIVLVVTAVVLGIVAMLGMAYRGRVDAPRRPQSRVSANVKPCPCGSRGARAQLGHSGCGDTEVAAHHPQQCDNTLH